MEEGYITSISENTTELGQEEPSPDPDTEAGTDTPGQQPGNENYPGAPVENHMPDNTEPHQDSYNPVDEDAIAEKVVEMLKPDGDPFPVDKFEGLLEQLMLKNEDDPAVQNDSTAIPHTIPIEGYQDWNYQITVNLDIYPYGLGHWTHVTEAFSTPEEFELRFAQWCDLVGDTVESFQITTIYDDDGNEIYNYEAYIEKPDPEPEEPDPEEPVREDDTAALLLSQLEGINEVLADIAASDADFYESVLLYNENMLELQKTNAAMNIIIAVGVFLIFGALLAKILMDKLR